MSDPDRVVHGDFHVIRMEGLFHVVFRPDSDPEWFRIIASFYTYDRAWLYCDLERVTVWDGESETGDEEKAGLRAPPVGILPEAGLETPDGIASLVRDVYDQDDKIEPHQIEDFSDHPHEDELPKDYHERIYAEAIAKQADKPTCAQCGGPRSPGSASLCRECYQKKLAPTDGGGLTEKQRAVFQFFQGHANGLALVNASLKQIADEAGVSQGSIVYLVETIERKGFIEVVERGGANRTGVYRLLAREEATS